MSNKADGNKFENRVCKVLSNNGFWVHRLAPNSYGQPADIIAVKDKLAYLIDAKLCSTSRGFELSRIEDNQEYAMQLWNDKQNGVGWFAMGVNENIYMFSLNSLITFRKAHKSAVSPDELARFGIPIEVWCRWKSR